MYNIIMYAIQFGIMIASLFNEKVRKMWRGEREAIRILREKVDPNAQYVWFHAASLGEFEQGRPLMEQLRRDHPEYKILLTFYSPSGYEVRKNYEGADIICYMPVDTVTNARRFLRTIRPVMAFFIKYEFWYNYLHILKHRQVPVYSVSSIFRPEQVFFKWYGHQYGRVLRCMTHFFVQNEESRRLLASIRLTNSTITGDTRFDRVLQIKAQAKVLPVVEAFAQTHKVFVAGSSWQPDEDLFAKYFNANCSDWRLVIAPHVVNEEHLATITAMFPGKKVVRYTKTSEDDAKDADVLLIDCYGLLSSIYRYGDIAYVGGGFGVGIHNVLEAAVWGMPVVFGPNNQRFQEAQELKAANGGFDIQGYDDLEQVMNRLTGEDDWRKSTGKAAGDYVMDHAGATNLVLRQVEPFLKHKDN